MHDLSCHPIHVDEQTPGGHEGGDGNGGVVVEDVREPGEVTALTEVAVVTETITFRTHDKQRTRRVADVLPVITPNAL